MNTRKIAIVVVAAAAAASLAACEGGETAATSSTPKGAVEAAAVEEPASTPIEDFKWFVRTNGPLQHKDAVEDVTELRGVTREKIDDTVYVETDIDGDIFSSNGLGMLIVDRFKAWKNVAYASAGNVYVIVNSVKGELIANGNTDY